MSLKSIFIIFGIISTIAIEASSVQYVLRPSKQHKRSFGLHHEAKRSQIHQHLRGASPLGTIELRNISKVLPIGIEIKRPDIYVDEVTKQFTEDAFEEFKDPEKEFADVILSNPNQVVRVLSRIIKDISWSEFVESIHKNNLNISMDDIIKFSETL